MDYEGLGLDNRLRSLNSLASKRKFTTALKFSEQNDRSVVGQYQLSGDSVGTSAIADNSISTAKLQNSSVTAPKIASNAVDSTEITGAAIDGTHISSGAVVGTHITNFNYEVGTGNLNATAGTADIGAVTGDTVRADISFTANGTVGIGTTFNILDRNGTVGTITHAFTFTHGLLTSYGTS